MQSISKYNKGMKYLLCAIDLFSKYAWVIPTKDKKGTSIVNGFKKIISKERKPNIETLTCIQQTMKKNLLLLKDLLGL